MGEAGEREKKNVPRKTRHDGMLLRRRHEVKSSDTCRGSEEVVVRAEYTEIEVRTVV